MIKFLKTVYEKYRISIEEEKADKRAKKRIIERNNKFPNCILANNCKVIDTKLSTNVVVHEGVILQNCEVGKHTYFAPESQVINVHMGNFCSIGNQVKIGLGRHPTDRFVSTYPAFFSLNNPGCKESFVSQYKYDETPKLTQINNDVWIGDNVIIPGGISIGNGAIVAAGSVVTKDVSPYAIVGGNPASQIRWRFNEEEIKFLVSSQWWNFDDNKLRMVAEHFSDYSTFQEVINELQQN